jgi:hypothetical protein
MSEMAGVFSVSTPRRTLLALAATFGALRVHAGGARPPEIPDEVALSFLPRPDNSGMIRVRQVTLKPGMSWSGWQPGRASIMVRSGVMTAPAFVQGETYTIVGGPTLGPPEEGYPSSWKSPPFHPPEFTQYFGFVAEDGDFGTIENNGTEDLVVIVIVDHPNPS